MPSSKAPRILLAVAALAVLAAVLMLVLSSDPGMPEDTPPSTALEPAEPVEPTPRAAPAAAALAARSELIGEKPAEPTKSALPPSYVAALGGLTGRIVEADATPVADLPLELFGGGFSDLLPDTQRYFTEEPPALALRLGSTRTGADGRFTFTGVDPGSLFGLGIDLGGARSTLRMLEEVPDSGATRDVGDIVLPAHVTFRGKVTDLDGEPVAGARVRASDLPSIMFQYGAHNLRGDGGVLLEDGKAAGDADAYNVFRFPAGMRDLIERFPCPTTHTDEAGEFVLDGVPTGLVTVIVDKPGFVILAHGPVPSGFEGSERSLGTLRLDPGDELGGTVRTADGDPVAGAEVLVGLELPDDAALLWPGAITAADGSFRITGLADTEHVLCVRAREAVDWVVERDLTPGDLDLRIQVPGELTAVVRAFGPDGEIVPRPQLLLRAFGRNGPGEAPILAPPRSLAARIQYDGDGAAHVAGLQPRTYELLVRADGYGARNLPLDLTGPTREFRVNLEPAHALEVQVVTGEAKTPVEHAAVAAMAGHERVLNGMPSSSARTDAGGLARLEGLTAGEYRIRVEHPGYAVAMPEAKAPGDPLTVHLSSGGSLVGRVHQGGQPLDGPRMLALSSNEDYLVPRLRLTDGDGGFQFQRLTPGNYQLGIIRRMQQEAGLGALMQEMVMGAFQEERKVEVTIVEGQETRLDIDLLGIDPDAGPAAYLRGRVLLDGRPARQAQVSARPVDDWSQRRNTQTDDAGQFDFGQVVIGDQNSVVVSVMPRELRDHGPGTLVNQGYYARTMPLQPGEHGELIVEIRTGSVAGMVEGPSGEKVRGASVTLARIQDGEADTESTSMFGESSYMFEQSGPDGSFEFKYVPTGRYQISVEAEGYADASSAPFDVPVGGAAPAQRVQLGRAVRVRGRVVLPDRPEAQHSWMQFLTDSGGVGVFLKGDLTFETEELAPGAYRVHLVFWTQTDDDWEMVTFGGETVIGANGEDDLVIHLTRQTESGG